MTLLGLYLERQSVGDARIYASNNYFMMVFRSFFIVLPVSMISSTIKTFFPAKLSKLSNPSSSVKVEADKISNIKY